MKKRIVTNIVSRGFGKFASHRFHPIVQKFINRSYVKLLKLDMREFKDPSEYESLNALFTRALEKDRPLTVDPAYYIAPCDALITELGEVEGGKALQIKGMSYDVKALLQECRYVKRVSHYINFYLSPRDYHRYHMPYTLQILRAVHIPGKLYPVNLRYLRKKIDLFIENERVILECRTQDGKILYIVLVGALNVGQMTLVFESRIETNRTREVQVFEYEDLWLKKGELLGYFKMGSTIVLFFEENIQFLVEQGDKVEFTQHIARRENEKQPR